MQVLPISGSFLSHFRNTHLFAYTHFYFRDIYCPLPGHFRDIVTYVFMNRPEMTRKKAQKWPKNGPEMVQKRPKKGYKTPSEPVKEAERAGHSIHPVEPSIE